MDKEKEVILNNINRIIKLNLESLNNGKYFKNDINLINNLDFFDKLYDEYVYFIESINLESYLQCKYEPMHISKGKMLFLVKEIFGYFDSITDYRFKFNELFNKLLEEKVLTINEESNEWNIEKKGNNYQVNANLSYNIGDVISFVHEFFHIDSIERISDNNVKSFSEFFSIYFETLAIEYLKNKYDYYDGLIYFYINRVGELYIKFDECYEELFFLKSYNEYGPIEEQTLTDMGYNTEDNDLWNLFKEFCIKHFDNPKLKIINNYPYLLGVMVSNYLLFSNSDDISTITNKVLDLYINIDNLQFEDILKELDFHIDSNSYNSKIEESIKNIRLSLSNTYCKKMNKRLRRELNENRN